jgi:hypothetical protein
MGETLCVAIIPFVLDLADGIKRHPPICQQADMKRLFALF